MKKILLAFALPTLLFLGCDKAPEDEPNKTEEQKEQEKEQEKEAIKGCMDPESLNYNPEATEDDGTCKYVEKKNT